MGNTFCNLNICGADIETVAAACPGCTVRSLIPNWITVVGESLMWGAAEKEAKRLSKELSCAVLSTDYFDGDYVAFSVYQNGKRVAQHIPAEYEGFARCPGKSGAFGKVFGLSRETEKTLGIVFKETSPEVSLHLLECVLGCPLWVDAESIDDCAGPDQQYLNDYLARKRAAEKIKNQTQLVLLDEVEGDFGALLTYPAVCAAEEERFKTFWCIKEGKLQPLFQREVPGHADTHRASARMAGKFLLTFYEGNPKGETAYVFSDAGEILEIFHGEYDRGLRRFPVGAFLEEDRVFIDGYGWNMRTHAKEWEIGMNSYADSNRPCLTSDGRIAVLDIADKTVPNGFLVSMRTDGTDPVRLALPTNWHWPAPLASGDRIYLGCDSRIVCYTARLEPLWEILLEERGGRYDVPQIDDKAQRMYVKGINGLTAIDLIAGEIAAVREIASGEHCYLHDVLPGIGPIMMTGTSSFEVWNVALSAVSRHRVKGQLDTVVQENGHTYVLTNTPAEREGGIVAIMDGVDGGAIVKNGCLRLYELK